MLVRNRSLARSFDDLATLLEIEGANPFKVRAYRRVAQVLGGLDEPVDALVSDGRVRRLGGVGDAIATKIATWVASGSFPALEKARDRVGAGLLEVAHLSGVGPQRARLLAGAGVRDLESLIEACRAGRVRDLKGFGEKTEARVERLASIAVLNRGQVLLPEALARTRPLLDTLQRVLPGALVGYVGDVRRGRETIQRADVLVAAAEPQAALDQAAKALGAALRVSDGELALDVDGLAVRVAVVASGDLGGESFRRTGAAEVVRAVDARLAERGRANERFASESALLAAAGLTDLPPECRETVEAVELSAAGRLAPVQRADLTAWLHLHTTWSDGEHDLEAMVLAASRLGARVVGVADHSRSAGYARGLTAQRLREQARAIAALNQRLDGVRVLHGTECDILPDGTLDFPDDVLDELDFVVASVHTVLGQPRDQMTARVLRALAHPRVRLLAHPTGRLLLAREAVDLDLEAVLAAAARHDVAVEVNANPSRLDLDWRHHALARRLGVKLAVGVDAHAAPALADVDYAVHVLRKGLVPAEQVITTWEPQRLIRWLRREPGGNAPTSKP